MPALARINSRPAPPVNTGQPGMHTLAVGGARDSYLYVPPSYRPDRPMPLVLLLHGAGGHAHDGLRILLHLADEDGLILVAPASNTTTWDIIANRTYGADRDLVDRALSEVFASYAIDATRLGIGGFSDGASYALSLGLANGDLFTHVLAFSPGFIGPGSPTGTPRVFVSHGRADEVLPIEPCSRQIVRRLRAEQYEVRYEEFAGGHVIPPEVARAALDWFTKGG